MTILSVYSTWMLIMKKNLFSENWLESVKDKLFLIIFLSFGIDVGNDASYE